MTERITTLMTANMMLSDIQGGLEKLTETQERLSSGRRINKPSDDPYGTSMAINLNGQLSSLTSFGNNVSDGIGWTQTSDSALSNINNAVQRVRELAVEGANGTHSAADLQAQAAEVNQLIEQIKQDANTQYNGQYLFAGTATTAPPYQPGANDTFGGNTSAVNRQIGPGATLQINADVSQVLGNGQGAADGKLLDTLRTIAQDMASGNTNALSRTDLKSLDTNLNALQQTQANVGSVEQRLQLASTRIVSMQDNVTKQLTSVQDADMAQEAINYSTQQAAYSAALQVGAKIVQASLVNFLQ